MKTKGLIAYMMTGIKLMIVGVLTAIPIWILGLSAVLLSFVVNPMAGGIVGIILTPVSLILSGYIATKLWKWR
jgi:hypothetical protein